MDHKKKAVGILAIGLAFIVTAVGTFVAGYFVGKSDGEVAASKNAVVNTVNTVNNVVENTANEVVNTVNETANTVENAVVENAATTTNAVTEATNASCK